MTQLKKLQGIMKERGIEGILISSTLNQRYISTFNYDDGYVLVLRDKAFLLTDFRYIEAANAEVNHDDFEVLTPKGHLKTVASLALDNGAKTILVEESALSLEDLSSFEKAAESIRFEKTFTPVKSELLDEKYKKFNALYEFSCNLK